MRLVAIGHLRDLPGKQVTAELVAAMEQATPADAPVFIELLGRRGDKEALSGIVKMVDHAEPDVRQTALRELSSLADGSTVALLASRAANGPEKERDAARGALARSRGTDIDKAIVAAIPGAEPNVAVELIKATAARRCVVAIAALEKAAESADEKVRNAAFSSLGTLVGKDDLAGLVRLLVNAQGESTSHIAEEALSAACLRMNEGQGRAAPVIAAMANAQSAAKAPLLRVLGRIGGDDAMVAVAEQCKTAEEQVKNIAVNVLADWKSPAAVDALLDIAKSGEKAVYRRQALKGYVRLISGSGKYESNKIFAGLTNAMTLATEAEDKKMVLEAMKGLGDMQTLKYVLPFLAEPELRPGAETAVLGIAPKLAGTNFEQAIAAIEEVHRMASSNGVRQQAAQQLGTLRSVCVAWLFAGSYQQQGKSATQLFDIAFDPEIPGKSVEWRRLEATNSELFGKFDLGKEPDRVGYVKTSIWSDKEQDARLAIGSDDGIKVWLNGEVVFANNATRGFKVDEDIVKIKLREGWNPLMIKVTQGGGDWLICCKVQAPSGEVLPGLKFEAK